MTDVRTDAESIGAALLVLDHARAPVVDLKPGDEVFLSGHVPADRRCGNDSGYALHTVVNVETIARLAADLGEEARWSPDWVRLTTDQISIGCSPYHPVYLVGHTRED